MYSCATQVYYHLFTCNPSYSGSIGHPCTSAILYVYKFELQYTLLSHKIANTSYTHYLVQKYTTTIHVRQFILISKQVCLTFTFTLDQLVQGADFDIAGAQKLATPPPPQPQFTVTSHVVVVMSDVSIHAKYQVLLKIITYNLYKTIRRRSCQSPRFPSMYCESLQGSHSLQQHIFSFVTNEQFSSIRVCFVFIALYDALPLVKSLASQSFSLPDSQIIPCTIAPSSSFVVQATCNSLRKSCT